MGVAVANGTQAVRLSPNHPTVVAAVTALQNKIATDGKLADAVIMALMHNYSLRITLKMDRGARGGVGLQLSFEEPRNGNA